MKSILQGFMVLAVALFVGFTGLGFRKAEKQRALEAQSYTNEDFIYSTGGLLGNTLNVEPVGYNDTQKPIACALFVQEVSTDVKVSGELAAKGFTSIHCGVSSANLN